MRAPEGFVQALERYDSRLRVRWGVRTSQWIIERKMAERSPSWVAERPNPYKSPRGRDLFEGWQDGYVHVLSVHPSLLQWPIVEETLAAADISMQGSWATISRKRDEELAAEDAAADKNIANWAEAASSEAFDRLQWLQGNRIATPFEEPAVPLVKEEARDGYTVRDRRVTA